MQDLLEENVNIRVEAGVSSALDELKKLCGKAVSQICRDLMSEAIQVRLLNNSEHPIAPALIKRYAGMNIFALLRDFTAAEQARPGYTFIESIKIGGVTRYIIATPSSIVAKGGDYEKNRRQTLRDLAPTATEQEIDEALERLRAKSAGFVDAKNKARRDKLRKENPEQAAEADAIIKAAEDAEKTENEK